MPDGDVSRTWFGVDGGEVAGRELLGRGATGIVCGSDLVAVGVARAAAQLGLAVPHQVSVIGFDGTDLTRYTAPALTTVRQDVPGLCAAAVQALLEPTAHPAGSGPVLFAPELVVRDSTAPAPQTGD